MAMEIEDSPSLNWHPAEWFQSFSEIAVQAQNHFKERHVRIAAHDADCVLVQPWCLK